MLKIVIDMQPKCCTLNRCLFHTTNKQWSRAQYNLTKKFLCPQLGDQKKKRPWFDSTLSMDPKALAKPRVKGEGNSRRQRVLNTVFMDHIVDIMTCGVISSELFGCGLEISSVRVLSGLQGVNVYWVCSGTEKDTFIDETLAIAAPQIRHELSQLRIVGRVPPITFVRDRQYAKSAELESCLAKADFGEDFVPSNEAFKLKSVDTLQMSFDKNMMQELLDLECVGAIEDINEVPSLPPLRSDIFSVPRDKIYKQVTEKLKQSSGEHRKMALSNIINSTSERIEGASEYVQNTALPSKDIKQWAANYIRNKYPVPKRSKNQELELMGGHKGSEELPEEDLWQDELDEDSQDF